jgi:hypothetical protein
VTCHPREKNYGDRTPPAPCVPHGGTPVAPQCPLSSRGDTLFSEQGPGIVVVLSCTKMPQPRVHLCQPTTLLQVTVAGFEVKRFTAEYR